MDKILIQIFLEGAMKSYHGIEVTENFYEFFAPYFLYIISLINDSGDQNNYHLRYCLSSYLSVIILGLCQVATSMRQFVLLRNDVAFSLCPCFYFAVVM